MLAPALVHPTSLHSAAGHLHILLHPEGEARSCALVRPIINNIININTNNIMITLVGKIILL